MAQEELIIVSLISVCIIICILAFIYIRRKIISTSLEMMNAHELEEDFKNKVQEIKKDLVMEFQMKTEKDKMVLRQYFTDDAVKRSKNIIKGRIAGHLVPFLGNNCLKPSEIVYLGTPIDMISFTNIESGEGIVLDFIEIKNNGATLNKKQKLIRNAVNAGRVYYRVVNIDND